MGLGAATFAEVSFSVPGWDGAFAATFLAFALALASDSTAEALLAIGGDVFSFLDMGFLSSWG